MTGFLTNRWLHIILLLALLCGAMALRYSDPKSVARLRHIVFDTYNKFMPRIPADDVVIVDIDEESLKMLGQWPWPRTEIAKIPDALTDMGARVVAFDIVFAEPDRTSPRFIIDRLAEDTLDEDAKQALRKLPDNDEFFARKIAENGRTVTAFVWTQQPTERAPVKKATIFNTGTHPDPGKFVTSTPYFATNLPVLAEAAAGNGSFSMSPEQDGLIRRVPLIVGHRTMDGEVTVYPALSIEALRVALGKKLIKIRSFGQRTDEGYGITSVDVGDYTIPTDSKGNIYIHYAGHRKNLYIPAWQVIAGQVNPERVKDKIVLVGTSAIGLLDLRSTPLDSVVPGVEVHAEIIEQIVNNQFLQRPSFFEGAEILLTGAVSLLVILMAPFVGATTLAFIVMGLIGSGFVASIYAYQNMGILVDPLFPALTVTVIFILAAILTNLRTDSERRMIKNAFGHYISKDLMDELASDPDKLKLGGEVRDLTVIFTDVRNFTTISEALTPAELIQMMNDFLTPMTEIVMQERGTVDKYMGDAMMAFWNAPLDVPDHARHACLAALKMIKALEPINDELKKNAAKTEREYHELCTGIGVATGPCSVGNMGSRQRFAYSALGDSVNLSARLEGQTKLYSVPIMVSERAKTEADDLAFLELDLIQVKGKTESERIFVLLGDTDYAQRTAFKDFKIDHDEMLEAYRSGDFVKAEQLCMDLKSSPEASTITGFYDLMADRCGVYAKTPPPKGWGGIHIAESK
jgi:adenylate cyclase